MEFLIMLIILVGIVYYVYKSEKDSKKQNKLMDEIKDKYKENYEKWEQDYFDFLNTMKQNYHISIYKTVPCNLEGFGFIDCLTTLWTYYLILAINEEEIILYKDFQLLDFDNQELAKKYVERKKEVFWGVLLDDTKNFINDNPIVEQYKISDIKYFKKFEKVEAGSYTTGGGGGGSSIEGAIFGGMIAGGVGAIIGSRKGFDKINSTTYTIDKSKTIVALNDTEIQFDGIELYDRLMDLIPHKEYNYYISKKQKELDVNENENM